MRRILFITGKLAEPSLRRMVDELGPQVGFEPVIATMPITVAALLTTNWVARHLTLPENIERIILPGFCRGELDELTRHFPVPVERGPKELRDLPEYFGKRSGPPPGYGNFNIEILAEINHAPRMHREDLIRQAEKYRRDGADRIDLGCDPAQTWNAVGETVRDLVSRGFRVSIDSFNAVEVEAALDAGADLVLSVNRGNLDAAARWHQRFPHVEVVAIPDSPSEPETLDFTIQALQAIGMRFRIDPILEPISFGFAASLGRYLDFRRRYPELPMMMGVGNLTELTDVDSAGINVLLAGFCQEQQIHSILATEVIHWAQSAVKEFDLARKLVHYAVTNRVLPKRLEPNLVMLRDPKRHELGEEALRDLASRVTDRNYRIIAERGELHLFNGMMHLRGTDPFELFEQLLERDAKMTPGHAFYLGYELSKAVTALTLGKNYTQDQALRWGFLTIPERSHRSRATSDA
ncbi:DUF6513 domain-containing protein [Tuwongella immobilis]|uniref:Pterin-binding domain-containing protein n=1 Tax=Tuwongella immobilis TaxID=692036 RepID=A0A6C2YKJ6_9BACT